MATVVKTFYMQAGTDDAEQYGSSLTWNNSRTYLNMGTHGVPARGPYTGLRFLINENIDPDTVTEAKLFLNSGNTGTLQTTFRVESGPAQVWADNSTDRPYERYVAAPSGNQVAWTQVFSAASQWQSSPDLSAGVKVALANITSGQYLGIINGNTGSSTGTNVVQILSQDWTTNTAQRPYLQITLEIDPVDADVTTVAPTLDMTVGPNPLLLPHKFYSNVSYHDSVGDSTRRLLDAYVPLGDPPPGGFPVVLFVHGGAFFEGSKIDINLSPEIISDTYNANLALVSINYKLADGNILFNTNTGWTRPSIMQDGFAALKWIKANAEDLNLNPNKILGLGYSAGGHIILELALAVQDALRDTYELTYRGASGALGSRYGDYPAYDLTQGRSMADIPSIKGVMSLAGPVSLKATRDATAVLRPFINLLLGATPNDGYPAVSGEGELQHYIMGTEGTIYEPKGPTQPNFPIGLIYSTTDTAVVPAATYGALVTAFDEVGYPKVSSSGDIYNGVGFSYWGEATDGPNGGHDRLHKNYSRQFLQDWYAQVLSQLEIPYMVGDKQVLGFRYGSDEVNVSLG